MEFILFVQTIHIFKKAFSTSNMFGTDIWQNVYQLVSY